MSSPINIPAQQPYRPGLTGDQSPFPENDGPYMGYTESSGHIYRAISSGSGKFVTLSPRCHLPFLSFEVEKDRAKNVVTIVLRSRDLKQTISHVLGHTVVPPLQLILDFGQVLQHYDDLRFEFDKLECHAPYSLTTKEMRLLVEDIILEHSLYDGLDIDPLHRQGLISTTFLQDVRQRDIDIGMNDLEECFRLGQTTSQEANERLEAQNAEIYRLAQTGRLDLVRGYCEPLLRSNEVRILFNPDLLSQILDKGFWDVYEYILGLVQRTRPIPKVLPNADYVDVTYDPLCVAIRLGHYCTVQLLVQYHYMTFMGYIEDASGGPDRVFTPLLAAVLWQQMDIIPLLLSSGPMYHAELLHANQLAADMGFPHVLQALHNLPKASTSAHEGMSAKYPVPKAPLSYSMSLPSPNLTPIHPSPSGNGSISGISNALSSSWEYSGEHRECSPTVLTPSIAAGILSQPVLSQGVPELYVSPKDLTISDPVLLPIPFLHSDPSFLQNTSTEVSQHFACISPIKPAPDRPLLIDYTESHRIRQDLGLASMERLQIRCLRIDRLCNKHGNSIDHGIIRDQCANPMIASVSGLKYLRNITRNQASPEIIGILQALLVADALICQLSDGRKREKEFREDLCRWKVLLDNNIYMDIFDEFVYTIWETRPLPIPTNLRSDEYHLQQDLVSCANIRPPDPRPHGTRLRTIQRQLRGTHQQDLSPCEGIALKGIDFLPDARVMPPSTKTVDPKVVMMLQSVAFSIFFATASSIQDVEDNRTLQSSFGASGNSSRSPVNPEDLLLSGSTDRCSYDSGIGMELPVNDSMSSWVPGANNPSHRSQAKNTSAKRTEVPSGLCQQTDDFGSIDVGSLFLDFNRNGLFLAEEPAADTLLSWPSIDVTENVLGLDASLGQNAPPMILSPAQVKYESPQSTQRKGVRPSSSETDLSGGTPSSRLTRSPKGAGLTCNFCGKEFSNRGNRNKHMNSACRKKSNPKFPCRYSHLGCTSMATTVWNRDSHEEKWCSYNPNLERNMKPNSSSGLIEL
ncbi:ankyrin repeat [Fusarium heterosporum]|uniref:Ankyrin repeat n=1 Tax=Fusarium heterosporum TaxID=42747 RepID=A0A8H5WVC2_FUSHE|nr:ankyrin repeat [Fusarium heterosporum]